MLALPFALKASGLLVGSLLLVGVGVISAYSAYLLVIASKYNEHTKSYRALADAGKYNTLFTTPPPLSFFCDSNIPKAWGPKGGILVDAAMVAFLFGKQSYSVTHKEHRR